MSILDQLRNWTPESGDGRSDFADDKAYVYRPRMARQMIRDVKGATDLRDAMPRRSGPNPTAGMVTVDGDAQRRDNRPFADEVGQPSEKQRALIVKLVRELIDVAPEKGHQAAEYTVKMTNNRAWKRGRGENTSRWIDTLILAVKHERSQSAVRAAMDNGTAFQPAWMTNETAAPAPVKPRFDTFDDITDGNYAIIREGKTHFYRITRSEGRGQYAGRMFLNIQERASAALFPVRGAWPQRKAILDSIRGAGVAEAHALYANKLGHCWRCNIALTDDTGNPYRVYGLGPDCGPKVMGAL